MVSQYSNSRKTYHFIDEKLLVKDKNIYTIIVGKNGTGKSTLMNAIIRKLMPEFKSLNPFYPNPKWLRYSGGVLADGKRANPSNVIFNNTTGNIIAYSISPFDKFPLIKNHKGIKRYKYLGIRDISSYDVGLSFFSKIVGTLIKSIFENNSQAIEICRVLSYLKYEKHIVTYFRGNTYGIGQIYKLLELKEKSPKGKLYVIASKLKDIDSSYAYLTENCIEKFNFYRLKEFIEIIIKIPYNSFHLHINESGIKVPVSEELIPYIDIWSYFFEIGIFKLQSARIYKKSKPISLNYTSSGELSVISCMLGIASCIIDNSVIFIDEPEISLHPEWQEKSIELLIDIFSHFKNCHFIVATHSPQVVAKLEADNCFILSMETGEVLSAKSFVNRSADFQLANIFNSPGFRNEYLLRIALSVLTKVNAYQQFDNDDINNYNILASQTEYLRDGDPVKELTTAIKELYKRYGRH